MQSIIHSTKKHFLIRVYVCYWTELWQIVIMTYTESLNQDQLPQVKMPSDSQDCDFEWAFKWVPTEYEIEMKS